MNISYTDFQRTIGVAQVPIAQAVGIGSSSIKPYEFGPFEQFALAHNKRPFQANWNEHLLSGEAIAHALERSSWANGIVGMIPPGYCVLDFDGPKAVECLLATLNLSHLEPSTCWFSGDPKLGGLPKILYRLPTEMGTLPKKIVKAFADGNALEILFGGHQVTLPGSVHSQERGTYVERGDFPIADAPDWLISFIGAQLEKKQKQFNNASLRAVAESDRTITKLLETLDPDEYDTWIRVGLALRAMGDEYYDLWDDWSSQGNSYRGHHETEKRWESFRPRVKDGYRYLCRIAGVKPPSRQQESQQRHQNKLTRVAAVLEGSASSSQELSQLVIETLFVQGNRQAKLCEDIQLDFTQRELHVLCAPKGNRKTSGAIKAAVQQALNDNRRVHVVTPTRILSISAGKVLGIPSHATPDVDWKGFAAHVVCPESIHHWSGMAIADVVVFDECDEVLERLLSVELVRGAKKLTTKEQFAYALLRSKAVILSQDMVSNTAVDSVKHLGNFSEHQIRYHLYEMPMEKRGKITVNLFSDWIDPLSKDNGEPSKQQGFKAWLNALLADVQEGKRVYLPMGNRKKARALCRVFQRMFPSKHICIFDGTHTFNRYKEAFADNPTQWVIEHQPDILIHTQVFNSGVSMETDWFDVAYEYGSALETAWAQSQRGERNRTSVFGGRLTERNVYVSNQGCLVPDAVEQALDVDIIARRLEDEVMQRYEAATDLGDNLNRELNLINLVPYQARYEQLNKLGSYFKRDLLMDEWARREWSIIEKPGEDDSELFQLLRDERARCNVQEASILASAGRSKTGINLDRLRGKGEAMERSPLARVKAMKKAQVDILGIGFEPMNTESWQLAWSIVNDSSISLRKLQVRALIQLDLQTPGIIDQLAQVAANSLVRCAGAIMPIQRDIIRSAMLLRHSSTVVQAINGTLPERWCRFDAIAEQTKEWCLENAAELRALSISLSPNKTAYAFNQTTYRLDCVSKILAMVGIEDVSDGIEGHNNTRYRRIKTREDAVLTLQAAIDKGTADDLALQKLDCDLSRYEQQTVTYQAVLERMGDRILVVEGIPELVEGGANEVSRDRFTSGVRSQVFGCGAVKGRSFQNELWVGLNLV